jgi:plasmid stabilization system protein ParE
VLQARLLAAANQPSHAQSYLHGLQQEFRELAQQARLFEVLWQIGGNRRDGEAAAAAYHQLLRQAPSAVYHQRLAALEMVLLSQAQPTLPLH